MATKKKQNPVRKAEINNYFPFFPHMLMRVKVYFSYKHLPNCPSRVSLHLKVIKQNRHAHHLSIEYRAAAKGLAKWCNR